MGVDGLRPGVEADLAFYLLAQVGLECKGIEVQPAPLADPVISVSLGGVCHLLSLSRTVQARTVRLRGRFSSIRGPAYPSRA